MSKTSIKVTARANLLGALWMIGASVAWSLNLVVVKLMAPEVETSMMAFVRALAGVLVLAPIMLRSPDSWQLNRPGLMLVRGAFAALALLFAYSAVSLMPIAQYNAIAFAKPLFIMALAVLILKEHFGLRRRVAAAVGFLGVLIIAQPGTSLEISLLVAIASATCASVVNILGKVLTESNSILTVLIYSNLLMALLTAPAAALNWTTPSVHQLGGLALLALFGVLAQAMFVKAMSIGEASFVANFEFLRLPMTAMADILLFSVWPDRSVWIGAGVIISSVAYISFRERQQRASSSVRDETEPGAS